MPRTPAAVGHLDADCFYVSAERVRDSFLVGKPVGVLGNQGACVIAKSYEMKAAGVKAGTPIWEALKLCPSGVYIKRDFRWYEALSRLMLDAVRQFSPRVEYYSIDEFFFQAIPQRGLSLQQTAGAMRDHILRVIGVPVTVGIARTRTIAKLISDAAKPFGALALLGRLPVTEITGIARRRAARLTPFGIHTCLDLALSDRALVKKLLTVAGEALWWELNGDPVIPLHTARPPHKMLARGGSLGGATDDADRLYAWVTRNVERLVEELEHHIVRAGALSVHVAHKDGMEGVERKGLASPIDRFDLLMDAANSCFRRAWHPGRAATYMHVVASDLRRPGGFQPGLFDRPDDKARAVADVKRRVNARHGRFTLRSGATLPLYDVYRDEAQAYDICDVRGKICF